MGECGKCVEVRGRWGNLGGEHGRCGRKCGKVYLGVGKVRESGWGECEECEKMSWDVGEVRVDVIGEVWRKIRGDMESVIKWGGV